MTFQTHSSKFEMSAVVNKVHSARERSFLKGCRQHFMNLAKSSEFRMLWLVLPSSGATIMARCLKSWYVEEYTNDAIGRGGGGLWVLARDAAGRATESVVQVF